MSARLGSDFAILLLWHFSSTILTGNYLHSVFHYALLNQICVYIYINFRKKKFKYKGKSNSSIIFVYFVMEIRKCCIEPNLFTCPRLETGTKKLLIHNLSSRRPRRKLADALYLLLKSLNSRNLLSIKIICRRGTLGFELNWWQTDC